MKKYCLFISSIILTFVLCSCISKTAPTTLDNELNSSDIITNDTNVDGFSELDEYKYIDENGEPYDYKEDDTYIEVENGNISSDYTYFIGQVVENSGRKVLISVTQMGTSGISVGSIVQISKDSDFVYENGTLLFVFFEGEVLDTYPIQLQNVTKIVETRIVE